ncbi:MAG: RluA family pseudouridine synthase [Patescibacteria group bacterium]|nr:RluA family pseudouridine synthase [Patescibacteria group bacterium]
MLSKSTIKITSESAGKRLDVFLSEEMKITRSQAQKMILDGRILLNGKEPKKTGEKTKENDKINFPKQPSATRSKKSIVRSLPADEAGQSSVIKIIAETPDYVVVEKPSGMLTHPTSAEEKNTVSKILLKKYPEIKNVGDDPETRPGIVHRLDKDASGILVVARKQKMFEHLKKQFQNKKIAKEYLALAYGKIESDCGTIDFQIGRIKGGEKMAARPKDGEGKPSTTDFEVVKRFHNCSLIRVFPRTGRTHQIRVHLFALGHPLVGDTLYQIKKYKKIPVERLMLHSSRITFIDINGEEKTFSSQTPEIFLNYL